MTPTELSDKVDELLRLLHADAGVRDCNSSYYESTWRVQTIGVATPPEMRRLLANIGWCRMYLDSLEERLNLEGFRLAEQNEADERMWAWWQANNLDIESGLAHLEAMIHGIAYITVAAPDPLDALADQSTPVIRVESPNSFYARIDPVTRRVREAIRLYRSPERPTEDRVTLMLPNETIFLRGGGNLHRWVEAEPRVQHGLGAVLVVPLLNRERLSDRQGASEITPELRSATDAASRTMMNLQAAAELMAVPQRLLFGVAEDEFVQNADDPGAAFDAYMARIIAFEQPDAHAFQYTAADLRNFIETLQELAKQVASYTGLPPQYLSFSSQNPASAEAIKSSESRLVTKCERKARMFGGAWEQVMRLCLLVVDGSIPDAAHRMESIWRNPATPTFAAQADAVTKLYANGMGLIPRERGRVDLGYSVEERRQMREWDQEEDPNRALNMLVATAKANPSNSGDSENRDDESR